MLPRCRRLSWVVCSNSILRQLTRAFIWGQQACARSSRWYYFSCGGTQRKWAISSGVTPAQQAGRFDDTILGRSSYVERDETEELRTRRVACNTKGGLQHQGWPAHRSKQVDQVFQIHNLICRMLAFVTLTILSFARSADPTNSSTQGRSTQGRSTQNRSVISPCPSDVLCCQLHAFQYMNLYLSFVFVLQCHI